MKLAIDELGEVAKMFPTWVQTRTGNRREPA